MIYFNELPFFPIIKLRNDVEWIRSKATIRQSIQRTNRGGLQTIERFLVMVYGCLWS